MGVTVRLREKIVLSFSILEARRALHMFQNGYVLTHYFVQYAWSDEKPIRGNCWLSTSPRGWSRKGFNQKKKKE